MSANQPTDAQQLAAAQEEVRLLREQLEEARTPQRGGTLSDNRYYKLFTVKLKDTEPLINSSSLTFNN